MEEFAERVQKGYVTSNTGMNMIKFEANMISSELQAKLQMEEQGITIDETPAMEIAKDKKETDKIID